MWRIGDLQRPGGVPVFSRLQAAMDEGRTDQLVFFAFDLLFLSGKSTAQLPLIERKERLQRLFKREIPGLRYSEHVAGNGPQFRAQACKLGLEAPSPSAPTEPMLRATAGSGSSRSASTARSSWVVGWTDPEGWARNCDQLSPPGLVRRH